MVADEYKYYVWPFFQFQFDEKSYSENRFTEGIDKITLEYMNGSSYGLDSESYNSFVRSFWERFGIRIRFNVNLASKRISILSFSIRISAQTFKSKEFWEHENVLHVLQIMANSYAKDCIQLKFSCSSTTSPYKRKFRHLLRTLQRAINANGSCFITSSDGVKLNMLLCQAVLDAVEKPIYHSFSIRPDFWKTILSHIVCEWKTFPYWK